MHLYRLNGYYQGVSKLVKADDFAPQNSDVLGSRLPTDPSKAHAPTTNFKLVSYQPHFEDPPVTDLGSLPPRQQCFLTADNSVTAPFIYASEGVPQHGVAPIFGSYDLLNLRSDMCFDRYGRYGSYGLGYPADKGGTGMGLHGDQSLTGPIWSASGHINWLSIDLGDAQKRCRERNQGRYAPVKGDQHDNNESVIEFPDIDWQIYRPQERNGSLIPRKAIVLRAWTGFEYLPGTKLYLRSLVNELSLQSGGEYDIHLLVEVKDKERQFWTSKTVYENILIEYIPAEFRSMTTLWSQDLMEMIYPGPFQPQFHDHGPMYTAMRSMHFALQWFMLQHPEYEYVWNWEMDIRYIGHWYELFESVSKWAKRQPRNHLWARNARYYVSGLFDNWEAFAQNTEQRSPKDIIDDPKFMTNPSPDHGFDEEHDEEADFITLNPIFNPDRTLWNRREDVTGYDTNAPIPERRAAIIAASRFSRRLLLAMHHETLQNRHSMASEMFPPSMALHHGLKAVYVPHPIYLEHDWNATYASSIFNGGPEGGTDGYENSVFGEGPAGNHMALKQSTYYYEAQFAEFLWWRWLGYRDYRYDDEGGAADELRRSWLFGKRKGRMCLRSMLFHPIKYDEGRST